MKRQIEFGALFVLLVLLGLIVYFRVYQAPVTPGVSAASGNYTPLGVQDPSLRFDLLRKIRGFEYSGRRRNIFSASLPPPPVRARSQQPPQTQVPVGPPPLIVPVKFFGYSADPATGKRKAFFTDGDDVFIVGEGEILLKRFRLLRIGNSSAELEEIGTGRRATVVLEDQGVGA